MGRELARTALGAAAKDVAFALTKPKPVPFGRFYPLGISAVMGWLGVKEAVELARHGAGPK